MLHKMKLLFENVNRATVERCDEMNDYEKGT